MENDRPDRFKDTADSGKQRSAEGSKQDIKKSSESGGTQPERPTLEELEMDEPVLPEIEQLRGKGTDEQLEAIKD